jgi:hypothetical protein
VRRVAFVIAIGLLFGALAGCESASENAGSTAGPGVDVRCLIKKALYPGQGSTTGVGDTDVEVQCAPS